MSSFCNKITGHFVAIKVDAEDCHVMGLNSGNPLHTGKAPSLAF
jgi:hypothetical protein